MDIDGVRDAYRRYGRRYDLVFGAIFHQGRRTAIEQMNIQPGDHVLEVGVGTGLSLPEYPEGVHVTGVDLSPEMIDLARARVERMELPNVTLAEMDASEMNFSDGCFDHVVAMYVLSVAPEPERVMNEMRRVCRPNGQLFVVNHFRNDNPVVRTCEKALAPLSRFVGFRPDFALEEFVERNDLNVLETRPVNLFGYWTMLRASRDPRSQLENAA